ncbi:carbohydrate ABC transporter permease [Leadbettera azotonutricia]|uniref:Putative binding-protein-dependent transport systems inner membrane component n=1 Tax=Leadbettera azotonutricia (strain ATCC BAA-888 / DSM 13862 / ZAS-9) TaxID=545695 RepID=F5Y9Z1_LEAAZ|nr:sugar ABC transporter permease [Leadbettera azotonutricia]AEF80995.1 putative binding-protein-dependent transport systems inner membrane component [Leadbettera azotonutricia ZAS-9]
MKKPKTHILFITPGFVLYTIFVVFPIFYVLYLSLFEWSGLGPMNFIGINNFITLFTNERVAPTVFHALLNNLKYLLCMWFIITPFQYIVAYLLFIRIPAYRYIKFMIFLPYVVSLTIISFFATLIFNPNIGILNSILESMGFAGGAWFGDTRWSFKLLVFLILWQGAGSGIMIFYSNMLDISQDIMDACRIDGCKEWHRFFYIFLPLSLPACASIITMSTIWALALFDLPFILGGSNGGVSGSLDFVNIVFYRYTFGTAMQGRSDLGFGASICAAMFIVMMLITFLQNKLLSMFEYEN